MFSSLENLKTKIETLVTQMSENGIELGSVNETIKSITEKASEFELNIKNLGALINTTKSELGSKFDKELDSVQEFVNSVIAASESKLSEIYSNLEKLTNKEEFEANVKNLESSIETIKNDVYSSMNSVTEVVTKIAEITKTNATQDAKIEQLSKVISEMATGQQSAFMTMSKSVEDGFKKVKKLCIVSLVISGVSLVLSVIGLFI